MKIILKHKKLGYDELNECKPGTFFQLASSSTLEKDVDNKKIYMVVESKSAEQFTYCAVSGEGELVTRFGPMIGHVLECDVVPYESIPLEYHPKPLEEFEIGSCVRLFFGDSLGELSIIVNIQTESKKVVSVVEFHSGKVFRYSKEILVCEHEARLIIKGQK